MSSSLPDSAAVLSALLEFAVAAVPLADLADRLGLPPELAAEAVADAAEAGWVDVWATEGGPAVVASTLAVAQLGLELAPDGRRWVPIGSEGERPHRSRRLALESELSEGDPWDLASLPDPAAVAPLDTLIAGETIMRSAPAKRPRSDAARNHRDGTIPRPALLIGLGPLWQGPTPDGQVCPVCRGVKIPATAYCLKCDAFGLDHLLPTVVTPPSDKPPPRFRPRIKASAHAHPLT